MRLMAELDSYSQVARMLGTDARTVSGLVQALGLEPKRHPSNARAKGLNKADVDRLRAVFSAARREGGKPTPAVPR